MLRTCCAAALLAAAICLPRVASATPSGLNNIPTADVVGENIIVLQVFSEFGPERAPGWLAGLKCGPAPGWEVGLDGAVAGPGAAGGLTGQAKYRLKVSGRAAVALGAANISGDRSRHGDVFPYSVVSVDLGGARGHLGRSWQHGNKAWFAGADAPVGGKATLRADWIQVDDGDEHLSSLGFVAPLSSRWVVEGWASFASAKSREDPYVLKMNFVVPLDARR